MSGPSRPRASAGSQITRAALRPAWTGGILDESLKGPTMTIPRPAAAAIAFGLSVFCGADAVAAPCRDLHGQIVACPPPKAPEHCFDIKTRQSAKCGTPGTEAPRAGIRRCNG
jgi:hypothetical protein